MGTDAPGGNDVPDRKKTEDQASRESRKKARGKSRYERSVGDPALEEARAKNLAREMLRLQRAGVPPEQAAAQALRMIQGRVTGAYGLRPNEVDSGSFQVVSDRANQFLQGHQTSSRRPSPTAPVATPPATTAPKKAAKGSLFDPTMVDSSKIPLQRAAAKRYGVTPRSRQGNLPLSPGVSPGQQASGGLLPSLATGAGVPGYTEHPWAYSPLPTMEKPGAVRKVILGLRDGLDSLRLPLPSRSPGSR